MDADTLNGFMQEVQLAARTLKLVTGAFKINYEIHGNTVPHLHLHLYPRYQDDPFAGRAIDYHQKKHWYTQAEYREFVNQMRTEIRQSMAKM